MNRGASRKEYLKLISEFPNITVDGVEEGNHVKVYLTTPSGKKILVVSRSASDNRAVANNRSLLRRWSKNEG